MTTDIFVPTDPEQVRQFLRLVADPVVELRQLNVGNRKRTDCGYFDDIDTATDEVLRLDRKEPPAAIYCTLNTLQPELLARYRNRMEDWAKATTTDAQIVRRRWLFGDLDPKRPAGIPSSDSEHQHAIVKAFGVVEFLREQGAGEAVVMDSGNGAYVLLPIDLPNDAEAETLVKRCLLAIAQQFDDAVVSIDKSVSNAARIARVAGTRNCKGDGSTDRPHRRAMLLHVPDYLTNGWNEPTSCEVLERIASLAVDEKPKGSPNRQPAGGDYSGPQQRLMVDAWLNAHGIDFKLKQQGDRDVYAIACPFNPEHGDDAAIFQSPDGKLGASCFHAGCNGRGWQQFKAEIGEPDGDHYDPPKRQRQNSGKATAVVDSEPWDDDDGDKWTSIAAEEGRTGVAFARRIHRAFGDDIKHVFEWGKWLRWTGGKWQVDVGNGGMHAMAEAISDAVWHEAAAHHTKDATDFAENMSNPAKWGASFKALAPRVAAEVSDLDANGWLLNCLNGTVDLRTGELRPHNRADLLTKTTAVEFYRDAAAPLWERFLADVFPDVDVRRFFQRLIGYAITGDVSEHVLPICHGNGSNGKSTALGALQRVFGDYAAAAPPSLLMAAKGERHPTELAGLFGRRLVVAAESDSGNRLNEGLVKAITGGDPITARRMKEDFWTFNPTHKLILATNHRPVVRGTDHGIWRRLLLIPFEQRFDEGRKDKWLPAKLAAESPGILAWCVRGCLEWQRDGLNPPETVRAATNDYRQSEDTIGKFLAEECLTGQQTFRVKFSDLYDAAERWATSSGEYLPSKRNFGKWLKDNGYHELRNNGMWYLGIALKA